MTQTHRSDREVAGEMKASPKEKATRFCRLTTLHLSLLLMAVCMLAIRGYGQVVTGTLTGAVTDTTGAVIPNANVTATDISTNVIRTATTTSDGYFNFPFLNPGQYRLEVKASGFATTTQSNVTIAVSTVTRINPVLTPGSVTENVTVTGAPPALQTESAQVSANFDTQQVTDTPVANRSFQALAGLVAGTSIFSARYTGTEDPAGTTYFNANGQSFTANYTMIDGIDDNEPLSSQVIYVPSPEFVQEVNVGTSNYSAEYGRVAGAVMNVSTRQGTNTFHGTLWEYNQVAALAARNWFLPASNAKPPLTRNDFGGTVGGPIIKNRTFFFGGYRGQSARSSSTSTATTPLPAFLTGDFSAVPGALIYNPFSGTTTGPNAYTDRQRFANNVIPSTLISAPASAIAKYWPAPNLPGISNNYVEVIPLAVNSNTYTARLDHNFTDLTKIAVTSNVSDATIKQSGLYGEPLGSGTTADDKTVTEIVNFTHGFSPTLLTELRLAYNLFATNVTDANHILDNAQAGIGDPNPYPISTQGLASMSIGPISIGGSTNYPLKNRDNLFQVVSAWTKDLPNQSLKWGVEVHRNRMDRRQPQGLNGGPRGAFDFSEGTTELPNGQYGQYGSYINTFAAFLLGLPQQTSRTYMTTTPTNRQTQLGAYFQDTWHVTPKLTLDLGIREDFLSAIAVKSKGGGSNYDPTTNNILVAGYGSNNLANNVSNQSLVQPRLGFAYSIDKNSVVRGGFAMSGWTGAYGFTGGTLSTQFPAIYNIQNGNTGGYGSLNDGTGAQPTTSLPVVNFLTIPATGVISLNNVPNGGNQQFYVIPTRNPIPYLEAWNLFVERSFKGNLTANIGYVGNLGRHTPVSAELNSALPGTGEAGMPLNSLFGRTASTTLRANATSTNYNALQANLRKRFSNGLSFTVAYAYSKAMAFGGGDQGGFTDNYDWKRNYGPTNFDSRHNLVISHVYELPFGKGKPFLNKGGIASYLASGWQWNGVLRIMSGTPFSISSSSAGCNCPGNGQFGQQIGPVHILHGIVTSPWFSTSSFTTPAPNTFGNAGYNTIYGPALKQYDMSVFRAFQIAERFSLQGRAEFYNVTNTPQFSNPDGTVTDGNFGFISGTSGNQRTTQLALKLLF